MVKKFLLAASFLMAGVSATARAEQGSLDLFADIPESSWEYQTLKGLHEKGFLKGLKQEQFASDKSLSAYEAALSIVKTLEHVEKLLADGGGKPNVVKGDVVALLEMKDSFKDQIRKIDDRLWDLQDSVDLVSAETEGLKERVHVLEDKAEWFQPNGTMEFRWENIDATENAAQYDGSDFSGLPAGAPITLKTTRRRDVNNDSNMKLRTRLKFTSEIDDDVTLTTQLTNDANFGRVPNSGTLDTRYPGSEGRYDFDTVMDQATIRWDVNDKVAVVAGRTQSTIGKGLVVDTVAPRSSLHGISATFDYFGDYIFWASYDKIAENADYSPLAKSIVNDPVENADADAWLFYLRGPFFSDKNEMGIAYVHVPELPDWITVPGALSVTADKLVKDAAGLRGQAAGLAATDPEGAALLRGQADLYETKAGQLQNLLANRTLMDYYPEVPGGLAAASDKYTILSFWIDKSIGLFKNVCFEYAKTTGAWLSNQHTSFKLGLDWGKNFKKDDWSFHLKYRRAESHSLAPGLSTSYLESYGYGANRRLIEMMYQYRVTPRMDIGLGMKWARSLTPYIVNTDPFTIADHYKHFSIFGFANTYF